MIQHGANGWLVKAGDQKSLGESLLKLLRDRDLRERLGRQARHDVAVRFTIETFISQILSLYRAAGECITMPRRKSAQTLEVKLSAD